MSNSNVKKQAVLASCRAMCVFLCESGYLSQLQLEDVQRAENTVNRIVDHNDADLDDLMAVYSFLVEMKDIVKCHQNCELMEVMMKYSHYLSQHEESLYVHAGQIKSYVESLQSYVYALRNHSESLHEHGRWMREHSYQR